MFNLIIWILIVVILVRLAKLIGAKTNEVKSRQRSNTDQNGACEKSQALIFCTDAKNATSIMEENNISKWRIYYV